MKKIVLVFFTLTVLSTLSAQVGIGRNTFSSTSVLMEFEEGTTKGIILPAVNNITVVTPINGMMVFDRSDAIVKYYQNGGWVLLSDAGNTLNAPIVNASPETGGGVLIGTDDTSAQGILELRSTDKALVLPKVANPHLNVPSPVTGIMVYDTASRTLAVFDGLVWNYWGAK